MMETNGSDGKILPEYKTQKLSRGEFVYAYLKDNIIAGVWLPGDRINDKKISEHLGVNRLSVREGLSKLVQDDIVEQIQWKGYYIRKLSTEEVRSFIEVRIALEQLAIRNILKNKCNKYFDKLETAINESEKLLKEGNHVEYMKIDFSFHEILYKASGNTWIQKIISNSRILLNILRIKNMF